MEVLRKRELIYLVSKRLGGKGEKAKDCNEYKLYYSRLDNVRNGVGILLSLKPSTTLLKLQNIEIGSC